MNPCKCGYYPDKKRCTCRDYQVRNYLNKISKPILERMDLCVETVPIVYEEINATEEAGLSSEEIKKKVEKAIKMQQERYQDCDFRFNSMIPSSKIEKYCSLRPSEEEYIKEIFDRLEFSARVYFKILRVARTIADLEQAKYIEKKHITEAVFYRSIDMKYWGNEV